MAKDLAIILNNGSVNSAVATALAAQKFRLIMLYAERTQQPGSRVRAAYDQQVAHFKPYREHTLSMPYLTITSASSPMAPPTADPRLPIPLAPQMVELLPLVAAAARFAVHYQAANVYMGLRVGGHGDELAQATEYVQIWNELMQLPCGQPELEIITPLLELEAWQVVDVGVQVATPFEKNVELLGGIERSMLGVRRLPARENAFIQAAKPDPLRVVRKV